MANFNAHLTGGAIAGITAAGGALAMGWVKPLPALAVAAVGFVAALAPDVDHDHGRPIRYVFGLATLLLPSATLYRVAPLTETPQLAVGSWVLMALAVAFPIRWVFTKMTVHRGIFHSVPATLIFGCLMFLVAARREAALGMQLAVGVAGALGYFAHLLLDELWAVDFNGRKVRVKKSFGTAIQLWGVSAPSSLLAYGLLLALAPLVYQNLQGAELTEQTYDRWVLRDQAPESMRPITRTLRRKLHRLPDGPKGGPQAPKKINPGR